MLFQPQNSTWGRRTYSAREVATLFVVRLEKQQGLSLPEIGEKLRKHPATGSEAEPGLLAVHIERLKERQEEVAGQLLVARALLMASQGEEPMLAGELIENEIDAQVVEALHKMVDEEARQDGMSAGCAAHRGWLARSFAPLVENADSSEASACAALALAGCAAPQDQQSNVEQKVGEAQQENGPFSKANRLSLLPISIRGTSKTTAE